MKIVLRCVRLAGVALCGLLLSSCASKDLVLELRGSVLYEKPRIGDISYSVADSRPQGGGVVVTVTLSGDPGLEASFDISPGIVVGASMRETDAGRYVGQFSFPPEVVGGPYAIIGRVRHERAGEVTLRDPSPLTISLSR